MTMNISVAAAQRSNEDDSGASTLTESAHPHSSRDQGKVIDPQTKEPAISAKLSGTCVTLHGHFYQPPRENPYLNVIEQQPSAAPFHDWNERIYWESYRPNAFAQVWNDQGELVEIVNNYEYFSFNIGPTLMAWLKQHGREVYDRILEGDRKSQARLGHGNAIAQVYNHIIMPLANEADKRTQIRWGKADFRSHFGRDPEGMWLAETAVDAATVEALIDEGIRFIILAPSQAERCRPHLASDGPGTAQEAPWQEVSNGQIDPTRPYRCWQGSRFLDVFFYDGPISAAIGFENLLSSAYNLAERLALALTPPGNPSDGPPNPGEGLRGDHPNVDWNHRGEEAKPTSAPPTQLISVATDGETFGHHKMGTEKCAAYAFTQEFPRRGWQVTNFAHYLRQHPPTWEVVLKPATAWSCAHGVDRWQADCGCARSENFHQQWRRPLRQALNWLRDQLIPIYVAEMGRLLHKPWQVRDEYIEVIGNRDPAAVVDFLARHQLHPLSSAEQVKALQLLEMERHTLLMYTSCGWFFEELSRPEGIQILRYAARALELAERVTGLDLEHTFITRLELAPSNVAQFDSGADLYRQQVKPSQASVEQVAAHWMMQTMSSIPMLSTWQGKRGGEETVQDADSPPIAERYGYRVERLENHCCPMGAVSLDVEQLRLTSMTTWETTELTAIAFQSDWDGCADLHCRIFPTAQLDPSDHQQLTTLLCQTFHQQTPAQFIQTLERQCPASKGFGLADLLPEVQLQLRQTLTAPVLAQLDQIYNRIYREHVGLLQTYYQGHMSLPAELQAAAQITLSRRLSAAIAHLEQSLVHEPQSVWSGGELDVIQSLEAIAQEAQMLNCELDLAEASEAVKRMITQLLPRIFGGHADRQQRTREIQLLIRLVLMSRNTLKLDLNLIQAQEQFWFALQQESWEWTADFRALASLLKVYLDEGASSPRS